MLYIISIFFRWKYGVSTELSPETIMIGFPAPDYNKLKILIGSYAQVFDAPSPTNTPQSCTHGAIALGATGSAGGAFYFLSLALGEFSHGINGLSVLSRRRLSKDLRFLQSMISNPLSNQQDSWSNGVKLFWTLLP